MTQLSYAGIGSRETPAEILKQMTVLSAWMSRRGWHLHSGGAAGADTAFAKGTPIPARTQFLPWPGYEHHAGPDCHIPSGEIHRRCTEIASELHPAWHKCGQGARKLHGRNVTILLGRHLSTPVSAVVCWTKGGQVIGGTGMGIRIAQAFDIPVLNFGSMHPREICLRLEEIRTAA